MRRPGRGRPADEGVILSRRDPAGRLPVEREAHLDGDGAGHGALPLTRGVVTPLPHRSDGRLRETGVEAGCFKDGDLPHRLPPFARVTGTSIDYPGLL